MGRAKYVLKQEDYDIACNWVSEKVHRYDFIDDYKLLFYVRDEFKKVKDINSLNAFCELYLCSDHWTQLKNVIRANRKRDKERSKYTKVQVTLDREAWMRLSYLAQRKRVTMSRLLIDRLEKEYFKELSRDDSL